MVRSFGFLALGLAVILVGSLDAKKKKTTPHVLLVIADDLGWNDIGYHSDADEVDPIFGGNSSMPTHFIDELAATGVKLLDQYVSPWCTPTRASLMTGRYPIHLGLQHLVAIPNREMGLPLNQKILPQFMKKRDYATHLIGKWHLGMFSPEYLPTNRGFDTFYGTYHNVDHINHFKTSFNANNNCPTPQRSAREDKFRFAENRTVYDFGGDFELRDTPPLPPTFTGINWVRQQPGASGSESEQATDRYGAYSSADIAEEANNILDHHDKNDPMFMMLAFTAVHTPMVEDPDGSDVSCSNYPDAGRKTLCSMAVGMDRALESVVNTLKEKDMYDDTVIIFLSDNGGQIAQTIGPQGLNGLFQSSNFPYRGKKASYLQGGIKVPAFVHAPKFLKESGIVKSGLIHAVDWFSTIEQLANGIRVYHDNDDGEVEGENEDGDDDDDCRPRNGRDGMKMWKFISKGQKKQSPRNELLVNIDPLCVLQGQSPIDGSLLTVGPNSALISGKWKFFENDPGSPFLGNCFFGDGNSPPGPLTDYIRCAFPNSDGYTLIDLEADPLEQVNLAEDEPKVLSKMIKKMNQYRATMVDPIYPDPAPASDPSQFLIDDPSPSQDCSTIFPDLGGKCPTWAPWVNAEPFNA